MSTITPLARELWHLERIAKQHRPDHGLAMLCDLKRDNPAAFDTLAPKLRMAVLTYERRRDAFVRLYGGRV